MRSKEYMPWSHRAALSLTPFSWGLNHQSVLLETEASSSPLCPGTWPPGMRTPAPRGAGNGWVVYSPLLVPRGLEVAHTGQSRDIFWQSQKQSC